MAKQTSRNRRVSQSARLSQSARASQSQAKELNSLRATLTDLQSKRFGALRLYQEEKIQRQKETARANKLLTQVKHLQASSAHLQSVQSCQKNTVTTDFFVAQLRGLGLAPSIPFASLTWHCLAMDDLLVRPPDVLAVLQPTAAVQDQEASARNALTANGMQNHISSNRESRSLHEAGSQRPVDISEDIENLTMRLQQLEEETVIAKRSVHENERLISDLKSQLDASTAACENLFKTVQEQRETIHRLS